MQQYNSMVDEGVKTPVVLFIYNRPETTKEVFDAIKSVEPNNLHIVADGPIEGNQEDKLACEKARRITEKVDWDSEVHRNYADNNLGLEKRVQTGLDWAFEIAEEAIILEDDLVPSPSFFYFCDEMLDRFRYDKRILDIVGTNYLGQWKSAEQDYHFSTIGSSWGWATWDDRWEEYDPDMELWENKAVREAIKDYYVDTRVYQRSYDLYEKTYRGEINTWNYQWGFLGAVNSAYHVVPAKNLITNIGFNSKGTNTTNTQSKLANLPSYSIHLPVDEHEYMIPDIDYSRKYLELRGSRTLKNLPKEAAYKFAAKITSILRDR